MASLNSSAVILSYSSLVSVRPRHSSYSSKTSLILAFPFDFCPNKIIYIFSRISKPQKYLVLGFLGIFLLQFLQTAHHDCSDSPTMTAFGIFWKPRLHFKNIIPNEIERH